MHRQLGDLPNHVLADLRARVVAIERPSLLAVYQQVCHLLVKA